LSCDSHPEIFVSALAFLLSYLQSQLKYWVIELVFFFQTPSSKLGYLSFDCNKVSKNATDEKNIALCHSADQPLQNNGKNRGKKSHDTLPLTDHV
jgi:hypothetical protein